MAADKNKTFLEIHQEKISVLGFWDETYKASIIAQIESAYKTEIIREWYISDIVINKDKVLLKWDKRFRPLDDSELEEKYGI